MPELFFDVLINFTRRFSVRAKAPRTPSGRAGHGSWSGFFFEEEEEEEEETFFAPHPNPHSKKIRSKIPNPERPEGVQEAPLKDGKSTQAKICHSKPTRAQYKSALKARIPQLKSTRGAAGKNKITT